MPQPITTRPCPAIHPSSESPIRTTRLSSPPPLRRTRETSDAPFTGSQGCKPMLPSPPAHAPLTPRPETQPYGFALSSEGWTPFTPARPRMVSSTFCGPACAFTGAHHSFFAEWMPEDAPPPLIVIDG